ncbi:MAG: polyprenyl diphosphate synthase, partial [Clostridia bacterium]|nr:polyprenyl diphosphate synthase [Clostridia bacterium]
ENASFYSLSTDKCKRPHDEVAELIKLMKQYLKRTIKEVSSQNIKLNFIGDLSVFDDEIKELINETKELAKQKTGMVLNIAVNYGGRDEIVNAVRKIAKDVKESNISLDDINQDTISHNLYTSTQPDVDLVIRTSGEYRTSNFLLWQSAYAEYIFTKTLWPDFNIDCLNNALKEYAMRNRRYGGV